MCKYDTIIIIIIINCKFLRKKMGVSGPLKAIDTRRTASEEALEASPLISGSTHPIVTVRFLGWFMGETVQCR